MSLLAHHQAAAAAGSIILADWWRVYITAYGGGDTVLIQGNSGWRGTSGGAYIPSSDIITFSASSQFSGSFTPDQCWTTDPARAWQSTTSPTLPQFNIVKFNSVRAIRELVLHAPSSGFVNRCATSLDIQFGNNGTDWTTLASFTGLTWTGDEYKTLTVQ